MSDLILMVAMLGLTLATVHTSVQLLRLAQVMRSVARNQRILMELRERERDRT